VILVLLEQQVLPVQQEKLVLREQQAQKAQKAQQVILVL